MKPHFLIVLLIAVIIGGCDPTVYEMEMTPHGHDLARTLTVSGGRYFVQRDELEPEGYALTANTLQAVSFK